MAVPVETLATLASASSSEMGPTAAELFTLREAIARAGEAFARFRSGSRVGAASPPWDAVVLTCATESQTVAAQEELERRRALGLFPAGCEVLALSDPPGGRAGSGGATLLALETLARRWLEGGMGAAGGDAPWTAPAGGSVGRPGSSGTAVTGGADEPLSVAALFRNRRVLLIHSGGESQRLPAYAALGKIFAPLPVLLPQAAGSAIFDWLYLLASALLGGAGEVTLLSGDVVPVFDPQRVVPSPFAVRGVALPLPAAAGRQFGVYVAGADGAARRILQKPSRESMAQAGAIDAAGRVAVDTGIVTIGLPALRRLFAAAGLRLGGGAVDRAGSPLLPAEGGAAPWDLYRDWLPYLAEERAAPPPATTDLERCLVGATEGVRAGVATPADGAFIHLGTTRDFHNAIARQSLLRQLFPFTSQRDSAVESGAEIGGAFAGCSLLGRHVRLAPGAVVDHCRAEGALELGEETMASGVYVPPGETLRVAPGRVCYQTLLVTGAPGRSERVTVVLGLDDNPKLLLHEATFNGKTLVEWLAERALEPVELWPSDVPQTLWEAKLFVTDDADRDRGILDWLQGAPITHEAAAVVRERWRQARRYALRDLFEQADAAAVAAWRGALVGDICAARVTGDVLANGDASFAQEFAALAPEQQREAQRQLMAAAEDKEQTPNALHRARYWRVLADLVAADGRDAAVREWYEDEAAAAVREAVSRPAAPGKTQGLALHLGRRARVAAPVRIDFGGGWTDTPPFSLERGGAVLNAAITLDGALPIYAEVEVIGARRLVLVSDDIAAQTEVATRADAAGYCDPADPFALLKACLVLAGVVDPAADDALARLPAGVGLRIRTGCRIPRGSGLGTSSIVGAALLRALGEVLGRPQDDAELSRQTLELEQIMTTGGGWQDQMGAIVPGIKLIVTQRGLEQRPDVRPVPLTPEQRDVLEAHLLVAYTGHHRLAKNILREVVMRYLGRDPLAMQALYQLRTVADQLARAAAALDLELFGALVNQAWLLNKTLDPQTSYPAIERLLSALAPHVYGAKLVGAGGGGFLVAVTRRPHQQALVADIMARDREFAYGYVVAHRIWDGGLSVSVE